MILTFIIISAALFIVAVKPSQVLHLNSGLLHTGRRHFYESIPEFTALSHDDHMIESKMQLFIIQFKDSLYLAEFAEILENDYDVSVINYVPENAFVVYSRYSDLFDIIQLY